MSEMSKTDPTSTTASPLPHDPATATSSSSGRQTPVGDDAKALAGAVRTALDQTRTYARDGLEQRPYVTLAAAASVGFVLGGGLTPRVLAALVRVGSRFALGALAQSYVSRSPGSEPPADAMTSM